MRFNTAIAKLIELTNRVTAVSAGGSPRRWSSRWCDGLAVRTAPGARNCGSGWATTPRSRYVDFPVADPALLVAESVTYPVQVNGKVRGRIEIAADATEDAVRAAALAEVATHLGGKEPRKVIVVPGRMVSVVA